MLEYKIEDSGTEPFDVTEAKEDLKIDFTDDDASLTRLITAARKAIENYCSVSLVEKTITLTIDLCEEIELPYGPVDSITSVNVRTGTASNGDAEYETLTGDEYTVDGENYKRFNSSRIGRHVIVYTTTPETGGDLILAVKNELAFRYENKGDVPQLLTDRPGIKPSGVCDAAAALADSYRRLCWI